MFLNGFTSFGVLPFLPLSITIFINPSANVFVFEDFNVHQKDCLTYFGGTDRAGELL